MMIEAKSPPGFVLKPGHKVGFYFGNGGGVCQAVYDENGKPNLRESIAMWEVEEANLSLPASDSKSPLHGCYKLGQELAERRERQTLAILLGKANASPGSAER